MDQWLPWRIRSMGKVHFTSMLHVILSIFYLTQSDHLVNISFVFTWIFKSLTSNCKLEVIKLKFKMKIINLGIDKNAVKSTSYSSVKIFSFKSINLNKSWNNLNKSWNNWELLVFFIIFIWFSTLFEKLSWIVLVDLLKLKLRLRQMEFGKQNLVNGYLWHR